MGMKIGLENGGMELYNVCINHAWDDLGLRVPGMVLQYV